MCKMARGEMVRYMAQHRVERPEDLCAFDHLDYRFTPQHSQENLYVFLRNT